MGQIKSRAVSLIHDTLQTTFPLSDAMINEAPWQWASLEHDRLLQVINGVKLPAVVDLLLHGPKWRNAPDLNPGYLGQATFSRRRFVIVSRNVQRHTVLPQSLLVAPSSVLRFH